MAAFKSKSPPPPIGAGKRGNFAKDVSNGTNDDEDLLFGNDRGGRGKTAHAIDAERRQAIIWPTSLFARDDDDDDAFGGAALRERREWSRDHALN